MRAFQPYTNTLSTDRPTDFVSNCSAQHALFHQQFEDGLGTGLRADILEHLSTATTGLGRGCFHTVGTALGLDHFQALGPRFGRLQFGACE
ncbi:hypothetical protein D9M73_241620 [compost metagenome]